MPLNYLQVYRDIPEPSGDTLVVATQVAPQPLAWYFYIKTINYL